MFELYSHHRMRSGETFTVRALDDSPPNGSFLTTQRNFGTLNNKRIRKVDDIVNGVYCQPYAKNFPTVDAIVAPDTLFQMTVAQTHDIKVSGLRKLEPKLNIDDDIF